MLKFYVLCSKEVKKGREREKQSWAETKSRPQTGSRRDAERRKRAPARPDYRKEDDLL